MITDGAFFYWLDVVQSYTDPTVFAFGALTGAIFCYAYFRVQAILEKND